MLGRGPGRSRSVRRLTCESNHPPVVWIHWSRGGLLRSEILRGFHLSGEIFISLWYSFTGVIHSQKKLMGRKIYIWMEIGNTNALKKLRLVGTFVDLRGIVTGGGTALDPPGS